MRLNMHNLIGMCMLKILGKRRYQTTKTNNKLYEKNVSKISSIYIVKNCILDLSFMCVQAVYIVSKATCITCITWGDVSG